MPNWKHFLRGPAWIAERAQPYFDGKRIGGDVTPHPGVYFLLIDERIVYVGKAWNISQRVRRHWENRMPFTHVAGIIVPPRFSEAVETFYMNLYEPMLNAQPGRNPAMWRWANAHA